MNRLALSALCFVTMCQCAPETGGAPPGKLPDMGTASSRIWIDQTGAMHDRALDDQVVAWAVADTCDMALFTVEPTFAACDGAGNVYRYTRQGLTATFKYGRSTVIEDPRCGGEWTNHLVQMMVLDPQQKGAIVNPQTCDSLHSSLTEDLFDRQWYTTMDVDFKPAGPNDLPGAGPA